MFETQKSGNKTSSGEIGLNIRTLASLKVGQDQVSGNVYIYIILSEIEICKISQNSFDTPGLAPFMNVLL